MEGTEQLWGEKDAENWHPFTVQVLSAKGGAEEKKEQGISQPSWESASAANTIAVQRTVSR